MSGVGKTLRGSLQSKIPSDGNWDNSPTSPDETFIVQIQPDLGRHADAEAEVNATSGEIKQNSGDLGSDVSTMLVAELTAQDIADLAESDAIRLIGEWVEPIEQDIEPLGVDVDTEWEPTSNHLPTTEGIEITNADQLHNLDVKGENTVIAVLDSQFNINNPQYSDQLIGTLGSDDEFFYDESVWYETPGGHGDAVTDIVAAMAPEADIVIGTVFDPFYGIFDALDELEERFPEADVCTMSVGYLHSLPINGTDTISARIDQFTDGGRIFTNSAGNSAAVDEAWKWDKDKSQAVPIPQEYGDAWDGPFVDSTGNDKLEFDDTFSDDLENSERLPIYTGEPLGQLPGDDQLGWMSAHWDADLQQDDQRYTVRMFASPNEDDPLTYPGSSLPVVSKTNNPWETIDVFVEWFEIDVDITNLGTDAWVVSEVEGADDFADPGLENPTFSMEVGQRYSFNNDGWPDHPFAFLDSNGNPLLTQDGTGSFESDSAVAWEDTGDEFAFTLTQALAAEIDSYQCEVHSGDMRGDVAVVGADDPKVYVEIENTGATGDHHFDVWTQFGDVNIRTPWATDERTIGIPATSQDEDLMAIAAVQAVDVGPDEGETLVAFERNAGDLKGYSSQGPTQDGRQGIDVATPSHVSTNARGPVEDVFGFNGTSAAAPHAGAVAALLNDSSLSATTTEIREAMYAAAGDIPDPDIGSPPNNAIGEGYVDAYGAYLDLAADGEYSMQVQGSRDVPDRTLLVDQNDDDRFGNDRYTISAIKASTPGEVVEVNVSAPAGVDYQVELHDNNLNRQAFRDATGSDTVTFDTKDIGGSALDPGTYLLAVFVNGDAVEVFPLIHQAYEAEITDVQPSSPQTGDTLEVRADVTALVDSPPAIEDVMLGGFTESDDTGVAIQMEDDGGEWAGTIADPPADEYQFHVAPRGGDNVSFEIEGTTIQEETITGDTSSADDGDTDRVISVEGAEPLGLSPAEFVTVELSDSDALSQVWSRDTSTASVAGQLQFSRPAWDNENLFVGGLDENVTAHARNSGELRWSVERVGSLSDSSPVLYDGRVYVGDGGGFFHAIESDDGTVAWSLNTADSPDSGGSAVTSTAGVADLSAYGFGTVAVFAANDGVVHAVEDQGGSPSLLWSTDIDSAVYSDIEIGEVLDAPWAFVTTTDGRVVVIDIAGTVENNPGDVLLDVDAPTDSFGSSSPLLDDGIFYVAGDIFHAIDVEASADAGEVVFAWQQSNYGGTAGSDPVLEGGVVFVGSVDSQVYAMDESDGSILWQTGSDGPSDAVASRPAVAEDRVIVGSLDGGVYVINRYNGNLVDSRTLDDPIRSDPVVVGDNIYVGTEGGQVVNLISIP